MYELLYAKITTVNVGISENLHIYREMDIDINHTAPSSSHPLSETMPPAGEKWSRHAF